MEQQHDVESQPKKTNYIVRSVDSAMQLLLAFERAPYEFGISELAEILDMSRNQVFRLVRTLERRGFLSRTDQKYSLGLSLVNLVRKTTGANEIVRRAAFPVMQKLTNQSGETSYLLVPTEGGKAMCIEVVESSAMVRSVPPKDELVPLNLGAAAKVLLTFTDPAERQWILDHALAEGTVFQLDPQALKDQIAEIALKRVAVTREEHAIGVDAVGAPIWNASGNVIAAVGIVGPTHRVRARLGSEFSAMALDAGRQISKQLGGHPDQLPQADLSGL